MSVNVKSGLGVYMPTVQVKVNGQCYVNALLDTGSSNSFCTQSIVDVLNVGGSRVGYRLSTLGQSKKSKESQCVALKLESTDGQETLNMSRVFVVDEIPINNPVLDISNCDHLKDIPVTRAGRIEILIGQDNAQALIPLDVRKGAKGKPFAVRTMFGWSINGPNTETKVSQSVISHFMTSRNIENDVNKLWKIENEPLRETQSWSSEDKRVIDLRDKECKIVDGHYEIPIPWRDETVEIPNNITVANSRLQSLKKSLSRKGLNERYKQEIMKLLVNGYAEEVPIQEIHAKRRTWYLSHHAVITDKKPDKLRIVFDCSSKYMGSSLNDRCLQGPDLNNKLVNILMRFRTHEYVVMADVEAMYHQVKIPLKDRNVLRFLWIDDSGEVKHYRMTSHLFGGVWCACSSTYALRRTIYDNEPVDLTVKNTVLKSFYVDDCLNSVKSKEEALVVIFGTTDKLGGFKLTKFVVNDEQLLKEIPEEYRAKEVKELVPNADSKALGIKWNVILDQLYFEVNHIYPIPTVTRRNMLSTISSIFDPLGLISPTVLVGKMLFHEATRLKLTWDEDVPEAVSNRWKTWIESLTRLSHVRVHRCIIPREYNEAVKELHLFSDASEKAYGSCCYIRCINKDGKIHTALRNKVTPLKSVTVPRLELQAALMSAKMESTLREGLEIDIVRSYFWTDSEIVLKYIRNEKRRFHSYVANRVSTIRELTPIRELTQSEQWNYVPGDANPADIVSRGISVNQYNQRWFQGPDYLKTYKSEWSLQKITDKISQEDPEVKQEDKKMQESKGINKNTENKCMNH